MLKRILFALFLVSLTSFAATSTMACVPGLSLITEYTWGPSDPVSICVLPGGIGQHRAFVYPGIEVAAELRFPLENLAGEPLPGVDLGLALADVQGGPPAVCDGYLDGVISEGVVSCDEGTDAAHVVVVGGHDAPEGDVVACGSGRDDPDEIRIRSPGHGLHTYKTRGEG